MIRSLLVFILLQLKKTVVSPCQPRLHRAVSALWKGPAVAMIALSQGENIQLVCIALNKGRLTPV